MMTFKKVILAAVLTFASLAATALPVGHPFMHGDRDCPKQYSQEVCQRRAHEANVVAIPMMMYALGMVVAVILASACSVPKET